MTTDSGKSMGTGQDGLSTAIVFGLMAALIWGAWPVLSRLGVQQSLTVHDIIALRFGVAGVILLPILLRGGIGGLGWGPILLMTCGAGVPYVWITVTGLSLAPAGHGGVIIPSTMLTCSTLGGWLFLKDRPTASRLLGLAMILLGVVLIGWHSFSQGGLETLEGDPLIGDFLFVAGGALWAIYTVTSRACRADPMRATALVSVFSMIFYLPYYFFAGEGNLAAAPVEEWLFQGVFQGLIVGILALLFYTKAVAILGAGRGAIFAALVPAIAVLLAYPLLDERPSGLEMAGVIVVTLGMIVALGLVPRRAKT
ncbi:MAG: DMT family transporter [Pseudomonadota bacterium]